MYIITTHSLYNKSGKITYGPPDSIYEFLIKNNKSVYMLSHSLLGGWPSLLKSKIKHIRLGRFHNNNLLTRSIEQIFINILKTIELKNKKNNSYIGVDPLNSFSGVFLKLFRQIDKNVYFIVDYSEKRFDNFLLNSIYKLLDNICTFFADEVWCVSTRILDIKAKRGIALEKLKLVPNSPEFSLFPKFNSKRKYNLIIVSHLSDSLDFFPIIDSIKKVSSKFPKIKLKVVGSGPNEQIFKKIVEKMEVSENIEFIGQLNHNKVIDLIASSYLGFAIYTDENSWNIYGDSMKAREYVAGGTPVIINNIPSTADDVKKYKAGLVISKVSSISISKFIIKCIKNPSYYQKLQKNSLKMAKDFDKEKILKDLLSIK